MKSTTVFVVLLLVNSWSLALGYTVETTEREIKDKVSASQPLQHLRLGATFILDSIKIDLVESTENIAIKTDIEIQTLGEFKLFGGAELRGGLRYQRETGEFFIKDPEIIDIEFRGVSDGSKERPMRLDDLNGRCLRLSGFDFGMDSFSGLLSKR